MKFSRISLFCVLALAAAVSAHAYELGPIEIHGFVSQGYLKSTDNNYLADTEEGTFEFNEVGVNFSTDITDKLRVGIQFLARDLGKAGNSDFVLDWAIVDYRWRDDLSFRFGKVKRPMGLYNEGRDIDMLRTFVFLPQSIYSESQRDMQNSVEGGGVYGTIPAGSLGSFEYQSVLGAQTSDGGANSEVETISIFLPGVPVNNVDVTTKVSTDSQIIWNTPLDGLRLGLTYGQSRNRLIIPAPVSMNIDADVTKAYVASVEYRWDSLTLAAEYQEWTVKMDFGNPMIPEFKSTMQNYYVSAAYRFTDWLEAGSFYSVDYRMKDDKDGDTWVLMGLPDFIAWQKDLCLTLRFDINKNWLFKLEGHRINGASQAVDAQNLADLEENWALFAAKTTLNF